MPAKTTATDGDWLKLLLNATPIANVADNAATGPLTNLYVSLHTAMPGVGGSQTTSEAAYTGYARQPVARNNGAPGWTVSGNSASPVTAITFPAATGGSESELWFGIGHLISGAGTLRYFGPIGTNQGPFAGLSGTNTLTIPAVTGAVVGTTMLFMTLPGSTLPTGIVAGTVYFVKTITGDQVTLSATSGGATLSLGTDGSGIAYISTPIAVSNGVQPVLTTSTAVSES